MTIDPSASDEQLMAAFRDGDAAAFDVLYRRYRGTLYRFLVRQLDSASLGEDVYQEVWMTLIRQRERWQPRASLKTFLYRIAHSRLVDHFRAQGRHGGFAVSTLDDDEGAGIVDACELARPEAAFAQQRDARALRVCLEGLPPAQREAFLFSEESGLGLADIAAITEVPVEAVKSRIRYAIRRLRECLAAWREDA